ncbi:glycosyltransferase family 39 protein, partial [Patescibacteria group bacterium]|nr:glycosyltransferase family 39 protein [Patescibacteria group bacterium]
LILGSSWNNSAIFDETAHVPAGYSYITQFDYRLNPEHPPFIKALAALPLLFFKHINFPTDTNAWRDAVNGQWEQGHIFLYEAGNNPDQILFWMRLPIMLLSILLGWLIFWWTKNRFENRTAVLALLFYAFSPNIIAHSEFVTTDIGAAFAFFAGVIFFIKFLENPSWKNVFLLGIIFGIAQTAKFSLFLLVPIYFVAALIWAFAKNETSLQKRLKIFLSLAGKIIGMGFIGLVVIWLVFAPFLINYPQSKNISDAASIIGGFKIKALVSFDLWLLNTKWLRPVGQYLFGLMMITQRQVGGNTSFFLGEISSKGSHLYFPTLYLLKEPLAYLLFLLIALWRGLKKIFAANNFPGNASRAQKTAIWIQNHPAEFMMIFFVLFYWAYSVSQPLNIGLRHVLPTFPFIYILVAAQINDWLKSSAVAAPRDWREWLVNLYRVCIKPIPRFALAGALLLWLIINAIMAFPNYLSYYNELAGGTKNGYLIATDSNYDWGQDLIRLKQYAEINSIQKIAVDYFGGGDPKYYLGGKEENWWPSRGQAHGYFAISANAQMGAYGAIGPGFTRKYEDSYEWLRPFRPIARAGQSIFIYQLP